MQLILLMSLEKDRNRSLVGMIAEGVLSYKDTYVGVSANDEKKLVFDNGEAFMASDDLEKNVQNSFNIMQI